MQPNLPPFTDLPDHNPSHLLPQLLGQGGLNIPFEPNKFGMFNGLIGKFPLSCGTANAITELRRDMDQPGRPHYLWGFDVKNRINLGQGMAKLLYLSVFSLAEQAGISMVSQNCATDGRYLAPRLCAYPTPDEASAINQGLREGIDLYVSDRSVDADTRACRKDWVASQQLKVTATTNLGDIVQATSLPILQGDLTRHGTVAKLLFTNNYFPDYAVCWDQPAMQRARREAMRPVETFSTAATQKRVING